MAGGAVGCVPRSCLVVVIRRGGDAGPGGDVASGTQSALQLPRPWSGLVWSGPRNAVAEKEGPQKDKTQAALSRNLCSRRVCASVRTSPEP